MANFTFVRYANVWEDPLLLLKGLDPKPGQRLASIASAGDNALALLSTGAQVVAFDLNPAQLAITEIRVAALRSLSYDEVLVFLGFRPGDRSQLWARVKDHLEPEAQKFYLQHPREAQKGLIHGGKFERYFQLFKKLISPLMISRKNRNQFWDQRTVEERRAFFANEIDRPRWRFWFKIFFSKAVMGPLGRDPSFFKYVQTQVAPALIGRVKHALTELDPRENPFLEYILTNQFQRALPTYLQPNYYPKIVANLDGLTTVRSSCEDLMKANPRGFDGYNLSDLFEYLGPEDFSANLAAIRLASKAGAKMAYWNMMAVHRAHEVDPAGFKYQGELSQTLFAQDRAFFYQDFRIDEVIP